MSVRAGGHGWDRDERLAASVKPLAVALNRVDWQLMKREIACYHLPIHWEG